MLLNKYIVDPEGAWIYLEKFVNDGSPSGFTNQHCPPKEFSPSGSKEVLVPIFQVPSEKFVHVGLWPDSFGDRNWQKNELPLHPLTVKQLQGNPEFSDFINNSGDEGVFAQVTAGGRTLSILPDQKWHFKLHYPGILGRVNRYLPLRKAIAGIENSLALSKHLPNSEMKRTMGFLPEVGLRSMITGDNLTSISTILRSATPKPFLEDEVGLIPVFSLFAKDPNATTDDLLLVQLLKHAEDPKRELIKIIEATIQAYNYMTFDLGLVPELNAQNILFSVDRNLKFKRAIIRDFGRIEKALHIRKRKNLFLDFISGDYKVYDFDSDPDFAIKRHSFSLDFKLCQYVLEPILDCGTTFLNMNIGALDQIVRDKINKICKFDIHKDLFPPPGKYYAHEKILLTGSRPYKLFEGNRLR